MSIFVCLLLFLNFILERMLKTNFQGRSPANNAVVLLVSLGSANFFDNLSPYHNPSLWAIFPTLPLFILYVLTEVLILLRQTFWPNNLR